MRASGRHIIVTLLITLLSAGIAYAQETDSLLESILQNTDRSRVMHDPEMARAWSASLYSKVEMDATHLDPLVNSCLLKKSIGFVNEYKDTSAISGEAFIPIMISETRSDFYHSLEPVIDREVIRANRISGADADNVMSQFSGDGVLKANFYRNYIQLFDLDIPSPAAAEGHSYYSYFLSDSTEVNGRTTYLIHFLPKKDISAPMFEGQMYIDAEDFAIASVHARLAESSNVNWIRFLVLDIQNRKLPDGTWFYDKEDLFLSFSPTHGKVIKTVNVIGHRQVKFDTPVFGPITDPDALASKNAIEMSAKQDYDDEWWEDARTTPLTSHEQGIYEMVDRVQASTAYKVVYSLTDMFSTGYLQNRNIGIGFGPWARTITFNDTEGLRTQLGFRTTKEMSTKFRLSGYAAYGWKDHEFKGRATAEYMIRRDITRKLRIQYKKDFQQLGQGTGLLKENNIFNSLLAKSSYNKQSMVQSAFVEYTHEFSPSFNSVFVVENRRMWGNDEVPLLKQDNTLDPWFSSNQIIMKARFSKDETVSRGVFSKSYVYTRHPVLTLSLTAGQWGNDWAANLYAKPEFMVDWNFPAGPAGSGMLHLDGGMVLGDVPYPLLKVHEGNETMFHNTLSFACMDYYQYASDRWVSFFYEHNFNGLLLGRIPLVKKLKLREMVTFRGAWGDISQENLYGPYQLLPLTETIGLVPYLEAGVGISNIFKVVRVDCFWKLTHRDPLQRNFAFNIGIDLNF